jgi:hypothetical protein
MKPLDIYPIHHQVCCPKTPGGPFKSQALGPAILPQPSATSDLPWTSPVLFSSPTQELGTIPYCLLNQGAIFKDFYNISSTLPIRLQQSSNIISCFIHIFSVQLLDYKYLEGRGQVFQDSEIT